MDNKLYRSREDRKICGVCGGLAKYFGCDSTFVRLITAILALCAGGGLLIYILAALIVPNEPEA